MMKTDVRENTQFRILSAIGIILVVTGHLGFNVLEIGGLFPYYSFHVFIFLFVSGYFYRKEAEEDIVGYIKGKCITLLLPYFGWNLFYGIVSQLLHGAGFLLGDNLSFTSLFLAPFYSGHQFMYNFPSWFVPILFLIEVINVVMRKILGLLHLNREWLIFAGCLILGIITVQLAIGGHVWGYYILPGRILFMLPGFQMGRIYREKLESHDTLSDGLYFLIVMGAQVLICIFCAGLAFGAVWVSSFANGPIVPYLTVITGIAFWLRIARILSEVPRVSESLVRIGRNTFSIMMHHAAVFMVIKGICYVCSILTPLCGEFDRDLFFGDIGYVYLIGGTEASKWIYLAAGILVPIGISMGIQHIMNHIRLFLHKNAENSVDLR
jgi:fucose 4-O-acetylase-like acetyltransferase